MDLWPVDIRRLGPQHASTSSSESACAKHSACITRCHGRRWRWSRHRVCGLALCFREFRHGRNFWPVVRLGNVRITFCEILGETAALQRATEEQPHACEKPGNPNRTFQCRPGWLPFSTEEHRQTRGGGDPLRRVLILKFEVAGLDAERILRKLCCNDIGGSVGRVTYTAMLNQRGGIETDCTVAKIGPERFHIVCPTAQAARDADLLRRGLVEAREKWLRSCRADRRDVRVRRHRTHGTAFA